MLYYILENKERKGPFSLEQLAEMGISPDTYQMQRMWRIVQCQFNGMSELRMSCKP